MKNGVHPRAIFHDLYIKKKHGGYSQIDLVVATPQGLIAIEVKDYSGWLFGNERQQYWTKVLNYGQEKYRFYNPIMQNASHIKALREQSEQFAQLPIYNVVLFDGDCTLKDVSYTSEGILVGYTSEINRVLQSVNQFALAQYTDKYEVVRILHDAVLYGHDPEIVASQIASAQKYENEFII